MLRRTGTEAHHPFGLTKAKPGRPLQGPDEQMAFRPGHWATL